MCVTLPAPRETPPSPVLLCMHKCAYNGAVSYESDPAKARANISSAPTNHLRKHSAASSAKNSEPLAECAVPACRGPVQSLDRYPLERRQPVLRPIPFCKKGGPFPFWNSRT